MANGMPLRFVFASDSFKGTLSSADTARLLEVAARRAHPGCSCVFVPMADGGEGTVDALVSACGGTYRDLVVSDPVGRSVTAHYGLLGEGRAVIELGDIESNLEKIENVVRAQVLPVKREGKIQNLAAFIAFEKGKKPEDTYENRKMIRSRLREMIPGYMVPKKIIFIDEMPLTQNGKCDRKALAERL